MILLIGDASENLNKDFYTIYKKIDDNIWQGGYYTKEEQKINVENLGINTALLVTDMPNKTMVQLQHHFLDYTSRCIQIQVPEKVIFISDSVLLNNNITTKIKEHCAIVGVPIEFL